ncbi:MAG TPA: type II toxin-antitoxin system VapC family toxin [bacterium]|nr:type II toxin-antitoxin system VapC family toxin [bacterium]
MPDRFVVDSSVVMEWCFSDEQDDYAERVLGGLDHDEAVAPAVLPLEVGNVLVVAERTRRLSKVEASRFLDMLGGMRLTVIQETPQRMFKEIVALAREHNLTTYDASYLDLAMRLGLPLATLDASLSRAARKCQVKRYQP